MQARWRAWRTGRFADAKYPPEVIELIVSRRYTQELYTMNDAGIANLQRGFDWLSEHKVLSGKLDVSRYVVKV
jgi:sulfonate transport system substrate-binding protein